MRLGVLCLLTGSALKLKLATIADRLLLRREPTTMLILSTEVTADEEARDRVLREALVLLEQLGDAVVVRLGVGEQRLELDEEFGEGHGRWGVKVLPELRRYLPPEEDEVEEARKADLVPIRYSMGIAFNRDVTSRRWLAACDPGSARIRP